MAEDIVINVEPPKPISVSLGGTKYKVRPIKGSLGMSLGQQMQSTGSDVGKLQKSMSRLVLMIFGPSDAKKVEARLNDPEDALDYPHILELMNALIEKSTGNPTT